MNTIKQKIKEIGLSQRQISVRLGKNPTYLAGVMRSGLSTSKQAALLIDLEVVARGDTVKSHEEIVVYLTQLLAEAQDAKAKYLKGWQDQIDLLKETLEYKQQHLTQSQKYLLEANKEVEDYKRKYLAATKLNWIFIVVIVVSLVLWSVV